MELWYFGSIACRWSLVLLTEMPLSAVPVQISSFKQGCFVFSRCQRLWEVCWKLLVQWKPYLLHSQTNRIFVLDRTIWNCSHSFCCTRRLLNFICLGSLYQISQHAHCQGHKPWALLSPPVFLTLLLFQLPFLHWWASRLELPLTTTSLWYQLCALHLLHFGEDQSCPSGLWG